MSRVDVALKRISEAADEVGLPEFARRSGVPYTTLAYWRAHGWRPRVMVTLAKAEAAAERINPEAEA